MSFTSAWRESPSSPAISCYRSVVFLPKEDNVIVLPGVLSHAYTFGGDLKPLFPQSLCRFTVCSISGDKTTMLTDCPDDTKCIVMWSLKNGTEITRTTRNNDVLTFAWSLDGRLLAISHSTGLICFVDVRDRFRTVAEHVLGHNRVCGMIKFSVDCRSLFCFRETRSDVPKSYVLNVNITEHPSITLGDFSGQPSWRLQSPSVAGFLLGDPSLSLDLAFDFVVGTLVVLRGYPYRTILDMFNFSELWRTDDKAKPIGVVSPFRSLSHLTAYNLDTKLPRSIAFSLTGEAIYVVSDDARNRIATAWDVSSEKRAGQVNIVVNSCLEARMKYGVLLSTTYGCLEMWNFELSNCIRRWPILLKITQTVPLSEERVALSCGNKVIILNTTTSETVSIPNDHGDFVTCNSKCQLLTCSSGAVQLLDGQTTLWKTDLGRGTLFGRFSLSERFVVICAKTQGADVGKYVFDAFTGRILRILCYDGYFLNCQFVSDEDCVILSKVASGGSSLGLFNVESGQLLTVIDLLKREVSHLAVCPRKRLLAIDQRDSILGVELIQVHLPRDKDSWKCRG